MLNFLGANWWWMLLLGAMFFMHLGHGRHGGGCGAGHAGHSGQSEQGSSGHQLGDCKHVGHDEQALVNGGPPTHRHEPPVS